MAALTNLFPNLVTKEGLLTEAELAPFRNHSSKVRTFSSSPLLVQGQVYKSRYSAHNNAYPCCFSWIHQNSELRIFAGMALLWSKKIGDIEMIV